MLGVTPELGQSHRYYAVSALSRECSETRLAWGQLHTMEVPLGAGCSHGPISCFQIWLMLALWCWKTWKEQQTQFLSFIAKRNSYLHWQAHFQGDLLEVQELKGLQVINNSVQ